MPYPPIIDYPKNRERLIAAFSKIAEEPGFKESVARGMQAIEGPKRKGKSMKLTYFAAECLDDNHVYSIRARLRRDVMTEKNARTKAGQRFGKVVKVVVEYKDAFDLAERCLGEGGLNEEELAFLNVKGIEDP